MAQKQKAIKEAGSKRYRRPVSEDKAYYKVARMILLGRPKSECMEYLASVRPEGTADSWCLAQWQKGYKRYEEFQSKSAKELSDKNIEKLVALIDDCLDKGDVANALKAMDMLNKMGGQYESKQNIKVTTDEPIVIKIQD